MTSPTETPSPATCPGCGGPTTFAGTIGTFCGNSGCDRVDDMRPAPSLTTEQARDFAARWAFWDSPDLPPVGGTHPQCLTDGEREQLFAWVRVLGGVDEDHSVLALLAAFGWEYHAGYGSPSYTDALTLLRAARAS